MKHNSLNIILALAIFVGTSFCVNGLAIADDTTANSVSNQTGTSGSVTVITNGTTTTGGTVVGQSGNVSNTTSICTIANSNGSNPNCPSQATPTQQPTAAPTPTPTPGSGGCTSNCGGGNSGGGSSSNSGSGSSSSSAPSQAVLGASTLASTGTFEQNLMNSLFILGMIVLSLGGLSYAKEKKKL